MAYALLGHSEVAEESEKPPDPESLALASRFEQARTEKGLKMREVGRRAMKNEGDYGLAIHRLRSGGSPRLKTVEPIIKFFSGLGYRAQWLRTGELPKDDSGVLVVKDSGEPRYGFAPGVVKELVDEGVDPERAKAVVFDLIFQEGEGGTNPIAMYKTARRVLDVQDGKKPEGRDLYAESDSSDASRVRAKKAARRKA